MTFPMLLPQPSMHVTPHPRIPLLQPTQEAWSAVHTEIERLYIRERRKLQYVIQYMKKEHGFNAT